MGWIMALAMAAAQAGAPAGGSTPCPATPTVLPADLAGWTQTQPAKAGADATTAGPLTIGAAARATLRPTAQVAFPARIGKAGVAGSGGVFAFVAPSAGRYRVALGSGAWVDIVASDKALASVGHGHGPACSGIHKIVAFDLAAGRYLLQIAGNDGPEVTLMVVRAD